MEPQKGRQLPDTKQKTTGAPGRLLSRHTKKRLSNSLPHPLQEERIHNSAATEKNPHKYRDLQQGTMVRSRPTQPHM